MNINETISELEERLRVAQLKSDIEELSALVDENLIFSGLGGRILGKEDDLNLHKSEGFQIAKMDLVERTIQSFETTVVVNTLMDATAVLGGNAQSDKIRYIRVWHKFPEGWRIVSGSMVVEAA